jgi:hypothetical protein
MASGQRIEILVSLDPIPLASASLNPEAVAVNAERRVEILTSAGRTELIVGV